MFSDDSSYWMLHAVQMKVRRPISSYWYSSHYTVKMMKHPDSMMGGGLVSREILEGEAFTSFLKM